MLASIPPTAFKVQNLAYRPRRSRALKRFPAQLATRLLLLQVYKVETAGDCYIVAGALMAVDEEGFMSVEEHPDARLGAEKVMAFSKVGVGIHTTGIQCERVTR